jgi:hypothetical protein
MRNRMPRYVHHLDSLTNSHTHTHTHWLVETHLVATHNAPRSSIVCVRNSLLEQVASSASVYAQNNTDTPAFILPILVLSALTSPSHVSTRLEITSLPRPCLQTSRLQRFTMTAFTGLLASSLPTPWFCSWLKRYINAYVCGCDCGSGVCG